MSPVPPVLVLLVAVLATSYSGPLVRLATAPAVAIAFWRLALVLPVTGALALRVARREQSAVRASLPLLALSGALLAVHFGTWIASVRLTSVASSVVLVSLRPVFAWAVAAAWLGERPGPRARWGIALAVLGAVLIGAGDVRLARGAVAGDALALAGALAAAFYTVIGRHVRQTVGVWSYVSVVYGVAALALGGLAVGGGTPLACYAGREWAIFGAMAAGPMLVGHTGMNYALRHLPATTVNVAALGEPVGATLIAWLVPAIHEVPPVTAVVGGVMVIAGIALALSPGASPRGQPILGASSHSADPGPATERESFRAARGSRRDTRES